MGEGTFGRVLECWDRKNKDYCAIKVVRNVKKYRDAAMIEVSAPHARARTGLETSVMIRCVGHWQKVNDARCCSAAAGGAGDTRGE